MQFVPLSIARIQKIDEHSVEIGGKRAAKSKVLAFFGESRPKSKVSAVPPYAVESWPK